MKSNINARVEILTNLLRGRPVSKLELALYDIDIDLKEIEYWREIARSRRLHNMPNKPKSTAPQITFNTKG